MPAKQVFFEDVNEGTELPSLVKKPTAIQLFRYSAVTWNAHRIHYDKDWAQSEGYPHVLVQAHLHGAFLTQLVTDWIEPEGILKKLGWSNRRYAVPGDTLTSKGKVVKKYVRNGEHVVELEIWEENQNGEVCVPGTATVVLPSR
ncbi:MAG: acyl dehydratase [Chloroflexi bacterium]|nr:acyl dehydratase [Chloroflexota bacterium]